MQLICHLKFPTSSLEMNTFYSTFIFILRDEAPGVSLTAVTLKNKSQSNIFHF